jgi:hypothetical protein
MFAKRHLPGDHDRLNAPAEASKRQRRAHLRTLVDHSRDPIRVKELRRLFVAERRLVVQARRDWCKALTGGSARSGRARNANGGTGARLLNLSLSDLLASWCGRCATLSRNRTSRFVGNLGRVLHDLLALIYQVLQVLPHEIALKRYEIGN